MSAWEDRPRLAVEANGGSADGQVVQLGSPVCIRDPDGDAEFYVVPPEEADAVADRVSAREDSPKPAAVQATGRVWRRRVLERWIEGWAGRGSGGGGLLVDGRLAAVEEAPRQQSPIA